MCSAECKVFQNDVCKYVSLCGGCSSVSVPYEDQVKKKEALFKTEILKVANDVEIEETVTGASFGYRSRARFRYSKDGLSFYEKKTNNPVIIRKCPVLDEKLNAFILNPPHLNLWELPDGEISCISTDKGVVYNSQVGWVTVKDRKFPVSGEVFFQSNRFLLPELIDYIVSNVSGTDVMDLYSGIGVFSAFLEETHSVIAVEENKKCLSLAKQHLKKTVFFTLKVERWKPGKKRIDTVIVDPPRVGLDKSVPSLLAQWNAERIIYVSCYLNTQLRDIGRLKQLGYVPVFGKLFDFYPHTEHTETVVILERR